VVHVVGDTGYHKLPEVLDRVVLPRARRCKLCTKTHWTQTFSLDVNCRASLKSGRAYLGTYQAS
jgi:hypothetical protein